MTVSFPFQQQHTWRKLGYLYFTDSLDYRQVLEENPQWKVTELPPWGPKFAFPRPTALPEPPAPSLRGLLSLGTHPKHKH